MKSIVLIANFQFLKNGGHSPCEDLFIKLRKKNWEVITASDKENILLRLLDMQIKLLFKRDKFFWGNVDVYSGRAFLWAEASCLTLKLLKKPYVLTLRGGNLPAFARRWPRRVRSVLHSASAVVSPSHYLSEHMRIYRHDIQVIPNPIELSAYDFIHRNQPSSRLIWLRAFRYIYNPAMAPNVLGLLSKDFPKIHLTMVGPDKKDGSLKLVRQAALELKVTERLSLPGPVPKAQVPAMLNQGDIFINTTNIDNTPVSVMEAMACGLCVVSTNVGGIPYLLEHEVDALLVPPDDPEAMAAAVRRILTEPGLAARLSQNARKKAEQFDWSIILPQWEALFNSIIQSSRPEEGDE